LVVDRAAQALVGKELLAGHAGRAKRGVGDVR
jgi:hypothetical protein